MNTPDTPVDVANNALGHGFHAACQSQISLFEEKINMVIVQLEDLRCLQNIPREMEMRSSGLVSHRSEADSIREDYNKSLEKITTKFDDVLDSVSLADTRLQGLEADVKKVQGERSCT